MRKENWQGNKGDAEGMTLVLSYAAFAVVAGLVGAVVVPWIYNWFMKPGRIAWATMSYEEREQISGELAQGFWTRVILGAVIGAVAGVIYMYVEQSKQKRK